MSSKTDADSNSWTWALVATVLVAAALRLFGLQSGLWYDEIVTLVESARRPLAQILTDYPALNVHPLYSVFAHASIATFGESAWALRLPACVFGIASVAMVYVLGSRLIPRAEAWAGAAVLATSYHHIWFSQNARGYTLMGLLTLVSTLLLLRAWESGRRRDYVIYALICVAGVYTHLTMVFVVVGQAAVLLVGRVIGWRAVSGRPLGPAIWALAGAALGSALAYAPFASSVLKWMNADDPREAAEVATASWAVSEAIRSMLSGSGVVAALAGGAIAAVGAISLWRRQPLAFALLTMPAAVTGVAIVGLGQPLRPRFFFFLSGAAAMFVGRGIGAIWGWILRADRSRAALTPTLGVVACTSALVAASAVSLPRNYRLPKQDFDGAVRFLESWETRGALITSSGPACWPFTFYYGKAWKCLNDVDDWQAIGADPHRVFIAYTLSDHIEDPKLRLLVRSECPVVQTFPGTLGQGDILVCEVHPERP
jgi:mannosyltransferase